MKPVSFCWCLLLACVLAGCGSERDEPFDPGKGATDDDADSDRLRITLNRILHDDQPLLLIDGDRQNLILRDEQSYYLYSDRYSDRLPEEEPDFDIGQVILLDLGERENNSCHHRLQLQSVYAEEYGSNLARLVVNLREREANNQAQCPEEDPHLLRPFYFYYLESRRPVVIAEALNNE